jgi:hypothetical protein
MIFPDAAATVGNTPLVELRRLAKGLPGRISKKSKKGAKTPRFRRTLRHHPPFRPATLSTSILISIRHQPEAQARATRNEESAACFWPGLAFRAWNGQEEIGGAGRRASRDLAAISA